MNPHTPHSPHTPGAPGIPDTALVRNRFSRSAADYDRNAPVQQEIVRTLFRLIRQYAPRPEGPAFPDTDASPATPPVSAACCRPRILEFGCGTGNLSRLLQTLHPRRLLLNDLCPACEPLVREKLARPCLPAAGERPDRNGNPAPACEFRWGDIREVLTDLHREQARFHLIASASALQWIERPEQLLRECRNLLHPNGLLAISTFGPGNLHQTAELSGQSLSYPAPGEWAEALAPAYRILYLRQESRTLHFPDPVSVLRHLKATGVNALSSPGWTPGRLNEFSRAYRARFARPDGSCPLTYTPLYLLCTPVKQ